MRTPPEESALNHYLVWQTCSACPQRCHYGKKKPQSDCLSHCSLFYVSKTCFRGVWGSWLLHGGLNWWCRFLAYNYTHGSCDNSMLLYILCQTTRSMLITVLVEPKSVVDTLLCPKFIVFDLCSHIIYSVQGKWVIEGGWRGGGGLCHSPPPPPQSGAAALPAPPRLLRPWCLCLASYLETECYVS